MILIRATSAETYKRLKVLIRKCVPIPQKTYKMTKRLKTPEEVEQYFPGLLAFTDWTEQQIQSRPEDKREEKCTILRQEKKTYCCQESDCGQ